MTAEIPQCDMAYCKSVHLALLSDSDLRGNDFIHPLNPVPWDRLVKRLIKVLGKGLASLLC